MAAVPTDRSLETLTAEDFRDHRGTRFRLTGGPDGGGSPVCIDAELAEVTEHSAGSPGAFRAPFSVVFHGPLRPVAPQGIYRIEHHQLGTFELFVVPVGPGEPSAPSAPGQAPSLMRYEVVFG
jgi:hypothetical protein